MVRLKQSDTTSILALSSATFSPDLCCVLCRYHYQPNEGFALASTIIFGVLGVVLLVNTLRYRQWFTLILAIGAFLECVGYVTRYLVTQGGSQDTFIVSYVLILVVPNFFALVNYSAVGRLLPSLPTKPREPTCLRIPIITDSCGIFIATRIAKFFFLSDVIAFFIQTSAAAFLTSTDASKIKTGQTIVEIGLAWGLAFIALFFFVTIFVYTSSTYGLRSHPQYATIRKLYVSLFVTITLLLVRSIYRMVDYVQGTTGYVSSHEAFFGVFDTGCMMLACIFYAIFPYGKYLQAIHYPAITDYATTKQQQQQQGMEMEKVVQVAPAEQDGPEQDGVETISTRSVYH